MMICPVHGKTTNWTYLESDINPRCAVDKCGQRVRSEEEADRPYDYHNLNHCDRCGSRSYCRCEYARND